MKTFNTEFEVFFEDISPSGIIHLEKIAEWVSMVRERYFKATCPEYLKFADSPVMMYTVNLAISVISRAKWADQITAISTVANIKRVSFEIHINFQNKRTNSIITQAMQRVAFVDKKTRNFANIPDDLQSVIVDYVK